jgi:hypothetical protein
VVNILVQ